MNGYEDRVRDYLRYCKRAAAELKLQGSHLDKRHHPTPEGACKVIWGDAKLIREAYARVTGDGNTKITAGDSEETRDR